MGIKVFRFPLFLILLLAGLPACNLPSNPAPTQAALPTLTPGGAPLPTALSAFPPTITPPSINLPTTEPTAVVVFTATPTTLVPTVAPTVAGATPTPLATAYGVVLVGKKDTLTVREKPGLEGKPIGSLAYDTSGIALTGIETKVGNDRWVEIQRPGGTGWVNAGFLTQIVSPNAFCSDAQVQALLASFKGAIQKKDGDALKTMVSPAHGLSLHYIRGGTIANYTPDEAGWVFNSTYQMNWGSSAGSGKEVIGTFTQVILPKLQDVLGGSYTPACDQIKTGGASYPVAWPDDYHNINYYSLYRPGPAGNELNWRTWLVGVEYVAGKPYLFGLIHLEWEP